MITVVVGQRGTGKTHFLKRVQEYLKKKVNCIDLDEYIEAKESAIISDIFNKKGESYFRDLEKKYFSEILQTAKQKEQNYFISVGGGFDIKQIPRSVRVLWLRRISEQWGRIFTDRPRLNPEISPIEEYFARAQRRALNFSAAAWEEYLMPEGLCQRNAIEKKWVCGQVANIHLGITVLPEIFKSSSCLYFFLRKRLNWGLKFFEVRDDLLNKTQFRKLIPILSKAPLLFALREGKVTQTELSWIRTQVQWIDCDQLLLDQYEKFSVQIDIVSRHHRSASDSLPNIFQELEFFEKKGYHVKLAVMIDSFEELNMAHKWFLINPKGRSFLPRSKNGRWQWYRQHMIGKMFIEFFREGSGSAEDQPTLYQVMQQKTLDSIHSFAAIIGDPVNHSFTPVEQEDFFAARNMPVYAVSIGDVEFESAMKILVSFGLTAAAVTSPLKKLAYSWAEVKDKSADEFQSINTIVLDLSKQQWRGINTDLPGLEVLLHSVNKNEQQKIAVWGGGGTLPLLQKLLPHAKYFSAQTGQLRDAGEVDKSFHPNKVIWAAPRADGKTVLFPPQGWRPQAVIDLNYREDSGGREYALMSQSKYLSGDKMFYEQAEHQRAFWEKYLFAVRKTTNFNI